MNRNHQNGSEKNLSYESDNNYSYESDKNYSFGMIVPPFVLL